MTRLCPALFIAAPASGEGKTTFTAALARYHRNQGLNVRVFKTGPDFLDPMILERASGNPVHQLDLWMGGEEHCRKLLYDAAGEADLILIEGAMGLYDGNPCGADLAQFFGIALLVVIDAKSMAQTFGAVAHGLASYREGLKFFGVVANRVGSGKHAAMLGESLPAGLKLFGNIPRDSGFSLPGRHLGLMQADEIVDLDLRIDQAARVLEENGMTDLPEAASFQPAAAADFPFLLAGKRIAVAKDAAFSFLYRANLDVLRAMGAELLFFSPLEDASLPPCDSLYFPGGYPELHLEKLAANEAMKAGIRRHHSEGKPIVAECGGMLYLAESLTAGNGNCAPMVGLLAGKATMQARFVNLGMQSVAVDGEVLRGHTFHYSQMETTLQPCCFSASQRAEGKGEAVYRIGKLFASYLHLYFPSNPLATAKLFGAHVAG